MKIFWSLTGYNNWMLISPSLNLELMLLPKVISRWEVTYFANISASKAKILKLKDCNGYDVKNILLMEILIYYISWSWSDYVSLSALNLGSVLRNAIGSNFKKDRKYFDIFMWFIKFLNHRISTFYKAVNCL